MLVAVCLLALFVVRRDTAEIQPRSHTEITPRDEPPPPRRARPPLTLPSPGALWRTSQVQLYFIGTAVLQKRRHLRALDDVKKM